jgi:hypothetical protein
MTVAASVPAGVYNFAIVAQNSVGYTYQMFTLTVNAAATAPTITSANNASFIAGTSGAFTVTASGTAPITWSLSGAPAGVSISSAGVISVTATVPVGSYNFTITASNGVGKASQAFTLTVSPIPIVTLTSQQITGMWYDPAYSGSGFNALMTNSGLVFYYYGWDRNGQRLWLATDVGPSVIVTGTRLELPMYASNGGHFLDPTALTAPPWGTLSITFLSASTATATLSGNDGNVDLALQMLAATTNPPTITGMWYDKTYSGSGFNVLMTNAGLVFYYYGWDKDGNRLWLASDAGATSVTSGVSLSIPLYASNGGSFLKPTPLTTRWGALNVDFSSGCTKATANLAGADGNVDLNLEMLAGVLGLPPGC